MDASSEPPATPTTPAAAGPPDGGRTRAVRLRRRWRATLDWIGDRVEAVERRWPQVAMLRELLRRWRRLNGTVLAGHLAFRMFLVLLPTVVLLVGVAGLAASSGVDVHALATEEVDMSRALSSTVAEGLQQAQDGRFALFVSGLVGLVMAALGMFSALYYGFAQAWEQPVEKIERRWPLFARFFGSFLVFVVLVMATSALRRRGFVVGAMSSLTATAGFGLAMLGLSLAMPRRATSWIWLLPGAATSAAGYFVLQLVMVYYLPDKLARSSQLYGSLGVAVALLFVLLLLADIVIASAFVNAVWWDHFHLGGADHDGGAVARIEAFAGRVLRRAGRPGPPAEDRIHLDAGPGGPPG